MQIVSTQREVHDRKGHAFFWLRYHFSRFHFLHSHKKGRPTPLVPELAFLSFIMSSEVEKVKREVPELVFLSFIMSSEVEKVKREVLS